MGETTPSKESVYNEGRGKDGTCGTVKRAHCRAEPVGSQPELEGNSHQRRPRDRHILGSPHGKLHSSGIESWVTLRFSHERDLPRHFFAIPAEESPAALHRQPVDHAQHSAWRLIRSDLCSWTTHVGHHPARLNHYGDDAPCLGLQRKPSRHHVEGHFAGRVGVQLALF
jgi:hypothetical protein